jgi:hypothetical protein
MLVWAVVGSCGLRGWCGCLCDCDVAAPVAATCCRLRSAAGLMRLGWLLWLVFLVLLVWLVRLDLT